MKMPIVQGLLQRASRLLRYLKYNRIKKKLPLKGYTEQVNEIKYIDDLDDLDLVRLNNLLNWNCFTVDIHGRRFGSAAWEGKRTEPQPIPDRRIVLMNDGFHLSDKHVLEIGCFEGIHTIGLLRYAKKVTAIDSRIENVVKTIVRCAMYGYSPTVFKHNIEEKPAHMEWLKADVAHHVGVLYHLKDPVQHLLDLNAYIRLGVMLDTHYALEQEATESYQVNGRVYRYKRFKESGYSDVFSGMHDHSKWLLLDDIVEVLRTTGFKNVQIVEKRTERNGPRVLLIAQRD